MSQKQRLSVTVDAEVIEAGRAAVASGTAESLSAWVNAALQRKAEEDRRLRALDALLADYEAEHGEITEEQMEEAERRLRERAIIVRGRGRGVA